MPRHRPTATKTSAPALLEGVSRIPRNYYPPRVAAPLSRCQAASYNDVRQEVTLRNVWRLFCPTNPALRPWRHDGTIQDQNPDAWDVARYYTSGSLVNYLDDSANVRVPCSGCEGSHRRPLSDILFCFVAAGLVTKDKFLEILACLAY
jgi:hypothetical protein